MKTAAPALFLLAAAPAAAQQLADPQAHRFTSSESGALASVEIHTVKTDHGRVIFALKAESEKAAPLAYTDDIRIKDATYMGNERSAIVPGSTAAVSLFQVMPSETHTYSKAIFGLCTGKGVPFVGLEPSQGSIRLGAFDPTRPIRLYVIEETLEPGKLVMRLCKTIDLSPTTVSRN